MRQVPDELLAQAAREGDQAALTELFERYQRPLERYAATCCRDLHLGQDAVQTVFVNLVARLATYDAERSFSKWIHGVTRNASLDIVKQRRSRRQPLSADDLLAELETPALDPVAAACDDEQRREAAASLERIRSWIMAMPPKQRQVMQAYFEYAEVNHEAPTSKWVAGVVRASHAAVRVRLSRGRKALRRLISSSLMSGRLRESARAGTAEDVAL